ncbi:MAG: sodium:solute symporter family protein [Ignavibacteria bacterium]|nr:sodium:solute symporter family protein [Ignavibacteria bacterium]
MKITLDISDIIIIAAFFFITSYIGIRTKNRDNSELDYLIAGRMVTLPAFVATLVSTFYGGILGIGEFTYRYGISSWFLNAFPYYVFITIFAFFLAKKIRKTELCTIPEKLGLKFGKSVSVFSGLMIFILSTPAPYVFMIGIIINLIFGISHIWGMLIASMFSVIFIYSGGLKSDIKVNIIEFIVMFLGFAVILPFCFIEFGGLISLIDSLPSDFVNPAGGHSALYIISWFIIGSWALVDPSFHQRCYAAKDEKTAKNGILISLLFWFIFDFMTTTAGLYSVAHIKGLANPVESYPALAEKILPPVAKGFFLTGILATILSTLHSYLFISASTFSVDIVSKFSNLKRNINDYTKAGIIVSAVISLVVAVIIPSVVEIWYTLGSLTIPPLLTGVILSYTDKIRIHRIYVLLAMVSSFTISLFSFISGYINKTDKIPGYLFGIEPMYPGLILSIIFIFSGMIINFLDKRKNTNV